MLPLFLRNVGRALKIQLHNCNPAYQLHRRKPSQNPIGTLQNTLVGSPFGSLTSSCLETSHHQVHLKVVDHMVTADYEPMGGLGSLMGKSS